MTDRISTGMLRELSEYSVSHLVRELAAEVIALQAEAERLRVSIARAAKILGHEAILAKPSEYDDDEQALLDDFSLRVGLENCRDCVREARAALNHKETDNGTS